MIQAIAIAVFASFLFGATSGGVLVHRWYSVGALQAQIQYLKEDRRRYQQALNLGEKVDDGQAQVEISNDDIERALRHRAAQLAPAPLPAPHNHVCLDGQWVLDLGSFK